MEKALLVPITALAEILPAENECATLPHILRRDMLQGSH